MNYFGEGLSEQHKSLSKILKKKEQLDTAKNLFLSIHEKLHESCISNSTPNEVDELLHDLTKKEYAMMTTKNDETIAWVLWHIARIEDLTMNLLVARSSQVFDETWMKKMNVSIKDTGNALTDKEIMNLSSSINPDELRNYRKAVGERTREIVKDLTTEDMKRKIEEKDIKRILTEGGVTAQLDSIWLLDYWGAKDVAGILLMPPSRHEMLHINDCCKWKQWIRSGKKIYRSE